MLVFCNLGSCLSLTLLHSLISSGSALPVTRFNTVFLRLHFGSPVSCNISTNRHPLQPVFPNSETSLILIVTGLEDFPPVNFYGNR